MTLLEIFHFETLLESKEVQNDPLYLAALDVGCPPQNRMRFACVLSFHPGGGGTAPAAGRPPFSSTRNWA